MMNQHKILKSNDCYNMMTGNPILNDEEAERLVYYYLLDKYKDDISTIELTRDIQDEEERIRQQLKHGDIRITFKNGKTLDVEVKAIGSNYPIDMLYMDDWYREKYSEDLYCQNKSTCDPIGWMYHMFNYDELYVYKCGNSWYNCKLYCINKPFRIQQDVSLIKQANGDINYKCFSHHLVTSDTCKDTVSVALRLNDKEARERYDIDVIELDILRA